MHEGLSSAEIDSPQLYNIPSRRPFAKTVADDVVTSEASPDVECRTVHINCQTSARDGKVGDGNAWQPIGWGHGDLAFRMESMLLEQAQEAKFERRANASRECFEPRARVVGVAALKRQRLWRTLGQLLQVGDDGGPVQFVVVSLVLVGLQTAVARGFAVWVIQMLQRPLGDQVKLPGDAGYVAAATNTGVHKRE